MNPMASITFITTAFSIVKDVAPLVPDLVTDVKTFVSDCDQVIADAKKLNASATIADIEGLFAHVQTDLPTVTQVLAASKSIVAA